MDPLRKLYYALPVPLRYILRKAYFGLKPEKTRYHNGIRIPKTAEIFTGRGDFLESGKQSVAHLKKYGGLKSDSTILDIGSGLGRIAIPLTDVLKKGEYFGFDIVKSGIDYCQKHIADKFPHFHFLHQPLHNDLYTSSGQRASGFRFPYPDGQFDVAVANSLFTHLTLDETRQYIHESGRVLKEGGVLYATFFVRTPARASLLIDNPNGFSFPYSFGDYSLMSEKVKGANVAYREDYLVKLFNDAGLAVQQKFYGNWAAEAGDSIDFQDVFILRKK